MIHLIMNQPSLVPMHWPCKIRPGAHIVYASAELNKKSCIGVSWRHVWYDNNDIHYITLMYRLLIIIAYMYTQQKLHYCVTDVRQQYPIVSLYLRRQCVLGSLSATLRT